jgi:hypothetical protein
VKKGILLLLILLILFPLSATTPVEYEKDEFPQWSLHLRRAETLFFGSLPITFAVCSLTYGLAKNLGAPSVTQTELGETLFLFSTSAALSLSISIIDYYLGK